MPTFLIFSYRDNADVAVSDDKPREEMRAELTRLREADPTGDYGMTTGETLGECRQRISEIIARRKATKDHMDSLPPVQGGEPTREEWDEAMTKLSPRNRGQAANLAAHSWGYVIDPEGIIFVGHSGSSAHLYRGDETVKVPNPKVCQSCIHTTRYFSDRGTATPMKCDLGHPEGVLRQVARASTCSAWKAAK